MARKTANRDEDIDPQAIARWNDEGGAPRPLKGGASRFGPRDAVELEIRPLWGDGTQDEQDPRRENRAAGVSMTFGGFPVNSLMPPIYSNLTPP
jgi:hypothetical protein